MMALPRSIASISVTELCGTTELAEVRRYSLSSAVGEVLQVPPQGNTSEPRRRGMLLSPAAGK
jgi:hypothetical protein